MTTAPITPASSGDADKPADHKPKKRLVDLWGQAIVDTGYTVVPTILLWGQARLELSNPELAVLIQLISHRWTAENDPIPRRTGLRRGSDGIAGRSNGS